MLNRLPKYAGSFAELLEELGLQAADTPQIAKALDVSESTVWRWKRHGAPRIACLSLWWLSREGHGTWDAEMANRTALTAQWNAALWRELGKRRQDTAAAAQVARPGGAANDDGSATAQGRGPLGLPGAKPQTPSELRDAEAAKPRQRPRRLRAWAWGQRSR